MTTRVDGTNAKEFLEKLDEIANGEAKVDLPAPKKKVTKKDNIDSSPPSEQ